MTRLALRAVELNSSKAKFSSPKFLQAAWETRESLPVDQRAASGTANCPMHEFLVRIRAQLLWA